MPASELGELRSVAAYIEGLPLLEARVQVRQKVDPENAANTELYWRWLGKSLDAYFSDKSDPLETSGLDDTFQAVIQHNSNMYINFSTLIFQGEKFLKKEAKILGRNYPFDKRSDLIKQIAYEEYDYKTFLSLQKHWESHSKRQRDERLRENQKFAQGRISEKKYNILLERWSKEDAKLQRDGTPAFLLFWTHFCANVFDKYKKNLPAYKDLIKELGIPKYGNVKKFVIIDGIFSDQPSRGRNHPKSS